MKLHFESESETDLESEFKIRYIIEIKNRIWIKIRFRNQIEIILRIRIKIRIWFRTVNKIWIWHIELVSAFAAYSIHNYTPYWSCSSFYSQLFLFLVEFYSILSFDFTLFVHFWDAVTSDPSRCVLRLNVVCETLDSDSQRISKVLRLQINTHIRVDTGTLQPTMIPHSCRYKKCLIVPELDWILFCETRLLADIYLNRGTLD